MHLLIGQVDTELFREENNTADNTGSPAEPLVLVWCPPLPPPRQRHTDWGHLDSVVHQDDA